MINKISLNNLKKYLEARKWKIINIDPKSNKITNVIDNEEFEIIIPNKEDLPDYTFRINQLLESLSSIERRNYDEIVEEINDIGYDTLQIRFIEEQKYQGGIPLKDGQPGSVEGQSAGVKIKVKDDMNDK